MHGGGENQDTLFSNDVNLHKILDHMIMNGDIEEVIDSLTAADQAAKLSNMEEEA